MGQAKDFISTLISIYSTISLISSLSPLGDLDFLFYPRY